MHPLDNVIWNALTTRQSHFAQAFGVARRFQQEVTSLCGFERGDDAGYASLAGLVGPGGTAALFLPAPYESRQGWESVAHAPLLQMVCENGHDSAAKPNLAAEIVELGTKDSPEMLALTALTKPGPFGSRTYELGYYVGIRTDIAGESTGGEATLVAMAGERLKVPGYTEVSAVCTHPDHTSRGYAQLLMSEVMTRIRERGETPILHVRADNSRAIRTYEKLGFRTRKQVHLAVLRCETKASRVPH